MDSKRAGEEVVDFRVHSHACRRKHRTSSDRPPRRRADAAAVVAGEVEAGLLVEVGLEGND